MTHNFSSKKDTFGAVLEFYRCKPRYLGRQQNVAAYGLVPPFKGACDAIKDCLYCQKKCAKILPLEVQQLVTGAVPLKSHVCTFYTPKGCILVP